MRYLLRINSLLLKDQTLGVGDFIDAIRQDNPKLYFSSGFLDHSKNSIEITSGKEFEDFLIATFKLQLERHSIVLELVGSKHDSTHKEFLNVHGYMVCGCGWIETFEQRRDREVKSQVQDMKVIKMEL